MGSPSPSPTTPSGTECARTISPSRICTCTSCSWLLNVCAADWRRTGRGWSVVGVLGTGTGPPHRLQLPKSSPAPVFSPVRVGREPGTCPGTSELVVQVVAVQLDDERRVLKLGLLAKICTRRDLNPYGPFRTSGF